MTAEESPIGKQWLEAHSDEFDLVEFNQRLGKGIEPMADWDDSTRRFVEASTAKRADIIASRPSGVTIVEVKVRIGLSALGQLLGYRELYREQHPEARVENILVIGASIPDDVRRILERSGVIVEIFPEPAG
jgi:RecB family endonuclease NucS